MSEPEHFASIAIRHFVRLREMTMTEIADQPPPVPNDRPSVLALVRADLEEREQVGIQRYGTPLQAHNGRDALVDAYQEALDLAAYLRQAIEERAGDKAIRLVLAALRNGELTRRSTATELLVAVGMTDDEARDAVHRAAEEV